MHTIDWLLQGEPYIEYATRVQLLGESTDSPAAAAARKAALSHPQVISVLDELSLWEGQKVVSHKSAGLLMHKLGFLADIGLDASVPQIGQVLRMIMNHISPEGVVQVIAEIPVHFGGTGGPFWAWCLCDAPVVMSALIRLGVDPGELGKGIEHLVSLARDNGFPCATQDVIRFRGPGKKGDPCPFATLAMLKLLAAAGLEGSREAASGTECLLGLWERSREEHPYIFYMGTDFRKLKAPLVWYDILHAADVLSRFPHILRDERLLDMVSVITGKADSEGRYTPESVWQAWKGWEFAQKSQPSRWLSFLVLRILKRIAPPSVGFCG